jgi:flagellar biosynthesis protein FlhG
LTVAQAAATLGITQDQLLQLMKIRADQLPASSEVHPDLYSRETIDALRSRLGGAKILSITSGKGGVGKTSFTVGLATELASRGHKVVVVDVDLGLANTHIMAGVRPEHTLSDFLDGRVPLVDVLHPGVGGVMFVSGGSGVSEMANLDKAGRNRILEAIRALTPLCDVIILDTGAGVSHAVTDFVSISDHTIVITTSSFAAIADAYGLIKIAVQECKQGELHLLVNRVRSNEEGQQVFAKLKGCSERFLGFDLKWLGLLPEDRSVEGAALQRQPFCTAFPDSVATRYLRKVAIDLERLMQVEARRPE